MILVYFDAGLLVSVEIARARRSVLCINQDSSIEMRIPLMENEDSLIENENSLIENEDSSLENEGYSTEN